MPLAPDDPDRCITTTCVYYNGAEEVENWRESTAVLSHTEREAAYVRARMILKTEMEKLVVNHGWTLHVNYERTWFHISIDGCHFKLPFQLSSMFSDSNNWVNAVPVIVERQSPNEIDLFVSEEVPPLVIIVHIIQVIAPGFLMLNFCYDYLCLGEVVWHTFFPDQGWLEENKDMLIHILGGRDKYDLILNHSEAYRIDVDFTYYYKGDSHTLINSELIKRNPLFPSELLVGSSQKF